MGAYLSAPVTEKHSSDGSSNHYAFGTTAMQGWRTNMEVRVRAVMRARSVIARAARRRRRGTDAREGWGGARGAGSNATRGDDEIRGDPRWDGTREV